MRFDAETGDWRFELTAGSVIGEQPAGQTREAIVGHRVRLSHPRGKPNVVSSGKT